MSGRGRTVSENELRRFISEDLYNELRYLLVAATEWAAYDQLVDTLRKRTRHDFPRHFKVLAMDSAFLHARSLYEFFTADYQKQTYLLTWQHFGLPEKLEPSKYERLRIPLHKRLMHLEPGRPDAIPIKHEVVTVAKDILSYWDTFSSRSEVSAFAGELSLARARAVTDSQISAKQYAGFGFVPVFDLP